MEQDITINTCTIPPRAGICHFEEFHSSFTVSVSSQFVDFFHRCNLRYSNGICRNNISAICIEIVVRK